MHGDEDVETGTQSCRKHNGLLSLSRTARIGRVRDRKETSKRGLKGTKHVHPTRLPDDALMQGAE